MKLFKKPHHVKYYHKTWINLNDRPNDPNYLADVAVLQPVDQAVNRLTGGFLGGLIATLIVPAGREVPSEFASAELRNIVANVGSEVGSKIPSSFLIPDAGVVREL